MDRRAAACGHRPRRQHGQQDHQRTGDQHLGPVLTVALGELDGRPIALTGGQDATVRVWDLADGTQHREPLAGHDHLVAAVEFGKLNGRPIALSGSWDETVRVWHLTAGNGTLRSRASGTTADPGDHR